MRRMGPAFSSGVNCNCIGSIWSGPLLNVCCSRSLFVYTYWKGGATSMIWLSQRVQSKRSLNEMMCTGLVICVVDRGIISCRSSRVNGFSCGPPTSEGLRWLNCALPMPMTR